ncbi:MAG TPA: DUF6544 family protein [Anaerolineales bacterium]|nr:DUF6544 family protein [Anaerolineales bacterium]
MKLLIIIASILVLVFLLGWIGLQIRPRPFSPYPEQTGEIKTIPLAAGLPAPVERFYKTVYGEEIPVIDSAVMKGHAFIAPFGVKLPARFLFVHEAGKGYRHYFEATWFGMTIMKVNERYVDGKSLFEPPVGDPIIDDASTNQAANLAVWAEAAWFPSIWITDPRVRWEPVDDNTALLFVPFEDKMENFVMRFNPETGLLDSMEAMRYRDAGPQAKKILWITRNVEGKKIEGSKLNAIGSATWMDQGLPWATFTLEEVHYNVNVSEYIRQKGP